MALTPFQEQTMKQIEQDPEFAQWCLDPRKMVSLDAVHSDTPCAKLFTYYTKDGTLHADRVGTRIILNRVSFSPEE